MKKFKITSGLCFAIICAALASCSVPKAVQQTENKTVPVAYNNGTDTSQAPLVKWKEYFTDPDLVTLIDTALAHNQELKITLQEIEIAKSEIRLKQAPLQPTVSGRVGAGVEKVGRYTSQGAGDASTDIAPGKAVPDALTDITAGLYADWEVDIWKKLRTSKQAAVTRYLSTIEGKNFMQTNLVAEIANAYYELLALDNQLEIVQQNITLQKNALEIVKVQKDAARVTELAVQKFSAEVLGSQSLEFDIEQQIKEAENKINFLLGRFPQSVERSKTAFATLLPPMVKTGVPSQLLANRADIRQAELDLAAAKLDVKVARAEFYPSFGISAAIGFQAFKPSYLVKFPESLLYSLAGDFAGPLVNRNALKAEFSSANARQLQAMYEYEKSILNGYIEVSTQLSKIDNLGKSYALKAQQVDALTKSIDISNDLFKNARADYLEVLMTQRDALDSKLELIETKKAQWAAAVNVYQALGGGWQ